MIIPILYIKKLSLGLPKLGSTEIGVSTFLLMPHLEAAITQNSKSDLILCC